MTKRDEKKGQEPDLRNNGASITRIHCDDKNGGGKEPEFNISCITNKFHDQISSDIKKKVGVENQNSSFYIFKSTPYNQNLSKTTKKLGL